MGPDIVAVMMLVQQCNLYLKIKVRQDVFISMNRIEVDYDNTGFWLKKFTDETGTYIIEGECNRCGKCCISPLLNGGYNDETGRCSKLIYETVDGKDCYRCSIYEKRPVGCVLWPRSLEDLQLINECSYKIRKV